MFRLLSDPLALFVAGDPQQGPRKGEGGDNQLGEKLSRPAPPPTVKVLTAPTQPSLAAGQPFSGWACCFRDWQESLIMGASSLKKRMRVLNFHV